MKGSSSTRRRRTEIEPPETRRNGADVRVTHCSTIIISGDRALGEFG